MNKKLLSALVATLLIGFGISACDNGTTPSNNSTPSDVSTPSNNSTPSTETDTMPRFNKALNDGARVRKYDERFDAMVNDFTSETLVGTTTGDATLNEKGFLRVSLESSDEETYPTTPDKAIYKQSPVSQDVHTQRDGIGFRIRVVQGSLSLDDLVLGLRGHDSLAIYEIPLADAVDGFGDALPEFSSEYQDFIISPNMTIEDSETVYKDADGNDSTTKVLDTIIGFHLYVKNDVHAVIEIEEVYGLNGDTKTVYDDFSRIDVHDKGENANWRDSTGFIVAKSVVGTTQGSYRVTSDDFANYSNVVLSLIADSNNISVAPVYGDTLGTAKAWTELKDDEGNAVVDPVSGCYGNYVINFENSGIDTTGLTGVEVSYTTPISLNKVFLTNMEVPEVVGDFPLLDVEHAAIFDDFNRTQTTIATTYQTGNATVDSKINDAGLNHVISYNESTASYISVQDGHAIFDCTNLGDGYIQLVEGSKVGRTGQQYMVLSVKTEDGATLDGLRFLQKNEVWSNSFYVCEGLSSLDASNPYVSEDGYQWVVIDLAASGLDDVKDELNIFYSGTGKLLIDSIFFCDKLMDRSSFPGEATKEMNSSNQEHTWASLGANNGSKQIEVTFKGNGTNDLSSFRIESTNNDAIYANAGLKMYVDGQAIDSSFVAPSDTYTTMIIDLEGSGWADFYAEVTLVLGDWAPGYMDVLSVVRVKEAETASWKAFPDFAGATLDATSQAHAYAYLGYNATGAKQMSLKVVGDGTHDLTSLRFESPDNDTIFANANLVMYVDGERIDHTYVVPTEGVVITFDLAASGWTNFVTNINIVAGDWSECVLTVSDLQFYEELSKAGLMSSLAERVVE